MRRDIINERNLKNILTLFFLVIYISLSGVYLFLPPLIGLCSIFFMESIDNRRFDILAYSVIYLLFFEIEKGFLLFSCILYLTVVYIFVVYRIRLSLDNQNGIYYIYICLTYVGFFIFSYILSSVLWIDKVMFDFNIILYVAMEIMLVGFIDIKKIVCKD